MTKKLIAPKLNCTFAKLWETIHSQGEHQTPSLHTTGQPGVDFYAEAKVTNNDRKIIKLPHNNRIYKDDWGFQTNSMADGDGQWIGHYSKPLDDWCIKKIKQISSSIKK